MNAKLFRDWEDAAQVDPRVARQFYMLLESVDAKKADELLEKAVQAKMSPMRFALVLKMERLDTTGVTEVIQKVRAEKMADPRPGPNFVIVGEERSDEKSRPVDPIRPMGGSRPKEASPQGQSPATVSEQKKVQRGGMAGVWDNVAGSSKTKTVWVTVIGGVILMALAGGVFFLSSSSLGGSLDHGGGGLLPLASPTLIVTEPPELVNPKPLDWGSAGWFSPLLILILFQIIGIAFALWGDAHQRDQDIDFWIPLLVVPFTLFLGAGLPDNTPWWVPAAFLGFELLLVLVVTIAGGLDFTPLGSYLLLVGSIGGFVFGRIEGIQAILHIPSAPVLPINQLAILVQRMEWDKIQFPVLIYSLILCGVVLMLIEGLRPSEDKNPKWGTFLSGGVGLLVYAACLYLFRMDPGVSYIVAYSLALVVASVSQRERVIRMTTVKWGIRSTFDGVTLFTSVLLIFNIATGVVG